MKRCFAGLLAFLMFGAFLSAAEPAKSDGRTAAAMELLLTMKMEKTLADSMEQMLQLQLQANPAIAPYKDVMRKFFMKYMSWESLKNDFARIYAEEFTEQELRELIAFYKTPAGAKAITKMPVLMAKGGQLGMQRVQQNMAEFNEMLRVEHTAFSRNVFAQGALFAAEWICKQSKSGIYGMDDVLGLK